MYRVTVLPAQQVIDAAAGACLLDVLRHASILEHAPCGGNGKCGKCKVLIDGKETLACRTVVDRDMTVTLPESDPIHILTAGIAAALPADSGLCLAVDIGTTTVVVYLLENGQLRATQSRKNPQAAYGADVVSRLQAAANGHAGALTEAIRRCLEEMTQALLSQAGNPRPDRVCIVGNPAMQQLFMGLPTDNLTRIPFRPLLTNAEKVPGGLYIPAWDGAELLIVPDISGYIGADTVGCILATDMDRTEQLTLLVDIGTNGEMVLGNRHRMVACATAAGPALEGAGIQFGMQASQGAIDRVAADMTCHVIGNGTATGICGSGLVDGVAVALEQGLINERGRIVNESHTLPLADGIFLTQEDIRQLQQAKGAIAAGIRLMAAQLEVSLTQIQRVYLAGAFGSFLDPAAACRIGLLPWELEDKIVSVGNAAGSGAMQMACDPGSFARADSVAAAVEHLDLATLPNWAKYFAQSMRFDDTLQLWCKKALALGFSQAVPLDPATLVARADVRAMCATDKCGAYGKNHTCPPHCGTLEECNAKMQRYRRGILLQTVGTMQKAIDSKAYRQTEAQHLQQFHALADMLRGVHPQALCLGSGGCRICKTCAYPDPCRFPEKACSSMEGYGLFVTHVCRDNGLAYHYGERTITYTACILF